MATKAVQSDHGEKNTIAQQVGEFLQKNRVIIISVIVTFILGFSVLAITTVINHNANASAYEKIETMMDSWMSTASSTTLSDTNSAEQENKIIADLLVIANSRKSSLAGARAYFSVAEIYFHRKDWTNAMTHYENAAKAAPSSYITHLAYYNAGIAADEASEYEKAISFLQLSSKSAGFTQNARVYFSIGRLYEQLGNTEEAVAMYEKLVSEYPSNQWASLGKTRIISLQLQ